MFSLIKFFKCFLEENLTLPLFLFVFIRSVGSSNTHFSAKLLILGYFLKDSEYCCRIMQNDLTIITSLRNDQQTLFNCTHYIFGSKNVRGGWILGSRFRFGDQYSTPFNFPSKVSLISLLSWNLFINCCYNEILALRIHYFWNQTLFKWMTENYTPGDCNHVPYTTF